MSVTRRQIEEALSHYCDYVGGTTSTSGASGGTTVVTTSQEITRQNAGYWKTFFLEVVGGACDGEVCQVADHTLSGRTATLTVLGGFSTAVLSGVTFRLHRIPPSLKFQAINQALPELRDIAPREIIEEMQAGQLAPNANFEHWRNPVPVSVPVVTINGTHTGGTGTLVVAASDAGSRSLLTSDYLCAGAADDLKVQDALEALP